MELNGHVLRKNIDSISRMAILKAQETVETTRDVRYSKI